MYLYMGSVPIEELSILLPGPEYTVSMVRVPLILLYIPWGNGFF